MNRKIILYIAISMDGFIADKQGSVAWLDAFQDIQNTYSYHDFIQEIDTVILGMTTYQQIIHELSPNQWVYEDMDSYVITHKPHQNQKNIFFTSDPIEQLVKTLRQKEGKAIWLCGGANLVNQFMKLNLIDEYHLTIMPYFLGKGIRLFEEENPEQKLKCIFTNIENGIIDARYIPIQNE